jgi:hypothetical protein
MDWHEYWEAKETIGLRDEKLHIGVPTLYDKTNPHIATCASLPYDKIVSALSMTCNRCDRIDDASPRHDGLCIH